MVASFDSGLFTSGQKPIEELAYSYYVRDGCADGYDLQHWHEAKSELAKAAPELNKILITSCDNGLHRIWSRSELS